MSQDSEIIGSWNRLQELLRKANTDDEFATPLTSTRIQYHRHRRKKACRDTDTSHSKSVDLKLKEEHHKSTNEETNVSLPKIPLNLQQHSPKDLDSSNVSARQNLQLAQSKSQTNQKQRHITPSKREQLLTSELLKSDRTRSHTPTKPHFQSSTGKKLKTDRFQNSFDQENQKSFRSVSPMSRMNTSAEKNKHMFSE